MVSLSKWSFANLICVMFLLCTPAAHVLAEESIHGTWELNLSKSKFDPGPAPKRQTRTFGMNGDMHTTIIEGVNAKGESIKTSSAYRLDGKDYPIKGSQDIDAISMTKVDANTTQGMTKRQGKVIANIHRKVSADGKTLTITAKGTNPQGQPTNNVLVFDRK